VDYTGIVASGDGTVLQVKRADTTLYADFYPSIQFALDSLTLGGTVQLSAGTIPPRHAPTMNNAFTVLKGAGKDRHQNRLCGRPKSGHHHPDRGQLHHRGPRYLGAVSPANGAATPGTGRGVMLAIPGGQQNRRPTLRRVEIACTPSWCVFDPGIQTFDGQANGTCPGNLWTGTSGALGSSGYALSINLHIEDCDFSFWGSNAGSSAAQPVCGRLSRE
jgi:hypothetical protein